ncbi:MAG TPA: CDP-alcohol phosphatidyltransferase family protein [Kofleriaceae bacterium]
MYSTMVLVGRPPAVEQVKHNQLLGPFWARFLIWLISPLERLLLGRVSPNMITALSLILCGVTCAAVGLGHLAGAAWLYITAGILDVLDGRLARLTGQQTKAGALFDSVSDRWGELMIFAGYTWYLHETPWLLAVLAAIAGSMMVSYTRARGEGLGLELAGGVMQRAERILLVVVGTLVAAWCGGADDTAYLVQPVLGGTMLICGVASSATAIHRWILGYRELMRRADPRQAIPEPVAAIGSPAGVAGVTAQPASARVLLPVRKVVAPLEQH